MNDLERRSAELRMVVTGFCVLILFPLMLIGTYLLCRLYDYWMRSGR